MKRWKTVCMFCFAFLLLAACRQNNADQVQPKEAEAPLTGLKTEQKLAERRPIAVAVNNHPKARPQSGLSKADVVIEALAEGRITRFLAIFQSEMPETVGPVRSARNILSRSAAGLTAYLSIMAGVPALKSSWSPELTII